MIRIIFIHGWGFDAQVWDDLAGRLPQFPQTRIDLGFFGEASEAATDDEPAVLVGHSLGFLHGMGLKKNWAAWVAINGFSRFVIDDQKIGCVPAAVLQKMRKRLGDHPRQTLADFYRRIGAAAPETRKPPHLEKLGEGLDELRDADLSDNPNRQKPGLVLAAENDPLVPVAASEALAFPDASLRWHPTGGHRLPQNAAAWCAEAITLFLNNRVQTP